MISDRVCIIKNGRLAAVDPVDALKSAQVRKYIITLDSPDSAAAFAREELGETVVSGSSVTVGIKGGIKDLIAVMARYPVTDIKTPGQSLEEVFLQYYGGDK